MPSGKFSFTQALLIPQVICFSLLQFDTIPLVYLGFRNLFFSNGYNNLSLITFNTVPKDTFPFFEFTNTSFFSNYNLTFIMACALPFLIGLFMLIV